MSGPTVRLIPSAQSHEEGLDVGRMQMLIASVDAVNGVVRNPDGTFSPRESVLEKLSPSDAALVVAAAGRANCDQSSQALQAVRAQSATDLAKAIGDLAAKIPDFGAIADDIRALVAGASTASSHWWGLRIALTDPGVKALLKLSGSDLPKALAFLAVLSPWAPWAGAVSVFMSAASKVLHSIVQSADQGKGEIATLYLWIVPWVVSAPEGV